MRTSLDINRSYAGGKINVRLIGLHDWREFRQEPAFDKSRRLYGRLISFHLKIHV